MERDFVETDGKKLYFYVQRKNIKNLNLKVNIDKKVTLSIPMKMPLDIAKKFIKQKTSWIKKQQEFYASLSKKKESILFENGGTVYLLGKQYMLKIMVDTNVFVEINDKYIEIHIKEKYINNKLYIKKIYNKWLKNFALNILENMVIKYQELLKKYDIKVPKIEIRQMKSRWGSCIPSSNKVIFNLSLIKTPKYCIEYVVLHELSHFKHQNHSKNFYNFVAIFMPNWKERKKILDEEFSGVV